MDPRVSPHMSPRHSPLLHRSPVPSPQPQHSPSYVAAPSPAMMVHPQQVEALFV